MDSISSITSLGNTLSVSNKSKINSNGAPASFAHILNTMIHKVNDSQIQADQAAEQLVTGKATDLHQVMIASEKANITLQTALEIRNKVIEAYQEVMRTQV
ncbi:flagellar hook-basal body complex protein FliE [Fictibacillus sp. Mic-4]|uniref:flagellar hook-basal body complex protein FliE n=1 Tax=Fictibacillus TaxID=1329200 RepID=UPI0006858342|nr:flagellar hook-basal body complex protein FliE [Fictibacillus gelatini]